MKKRIVSCKQYLNLQRIYARQASVSCSGSILLMWELNLWSSSYRWVSHRAAACLLVLELNQVQMLLLMTPPGTVGQVRPIVKLCVCAHLHSCILLVALWLWPFNLLISGTFKCWNVLSEVAENIEQHKPLQQQEMSVCFCYFVLVLIFVYCIDFCNICEFFI